MSNSCLVLNTFANPRTRKAPAACRSRDPAVTVTSTRAILKLKPSHWIHPFYAGLNCNWGPGSVQENTLFALSDVRLQYAQRHADRLKHFGCHQHLYRTLWRSAGLNRSWGPVLACEIRGQGRGVAHAPNPPSFCGRHRSFQPINQV